VLIYVGDDVGDLLIAITKAAERSLNGLIDDRHRATTDGFFVFTSPRSGSIPVVSQSMRNEIVPSVREPSPGRCAHHRSQWIQQRCPKTLVLPPQGRSDKALIDLPQAPSRCIRKTSSIGSNIFP